MRISTRSISLFRDLVTVGRAGRGQGTSPRSSLSAGCRFRPLSCLECLLYDEREKRGTRAAEIQTSGPAIVGVNLCLVRRLFSRLFTRPRQCRRRRGARVLRPAAGPRAHHIRQRSSRFVGLSSLGVSSSPFLLGTAEVP